MRNRRQDPTQFAIWVRAAMIRRTWDLATERKRRVTPVPHWWPPRYTEDELLRAAERRDPEA